VQQNGISGAPHIVPRSSSTAEVRQDDQDCLFLSGVRLHLSCCTPEEQLQLVRIAREGCALRHTDLSPGLTHIVVSIESFTSLLPSCMHLAFLQKATRCRDRVSTCTLHESTKVGGVHVSILVSGAGRI